MQVLRSHVIALLAALLVAAPGIVAYDALGDPGMRPGYRERCGTCHPRDGQDEPSLDAWWNLRPVVPGDFPERSGPVEVALVLENGFQQRIRKIDAALNLDPIREAATFEDTNSTFTGTIEEMGRGPTNRELLTPAAVTQFNATFEADSPGPHWNVSILREGERVAGCRTGPAVPPETQRTCRITWERTASAPNGTGTWGYDIRMAPASNEIVRTSDWTLSGQISYRSPRHIHHKNAQSGGLATLEPGETRRVQWRVLVQDPAGVPEELALPFHVTAEFAYDHDGDGTCSGYRDCAAVSTTVTGRPGGAALGDAEGAGPALLPFLGAADGVLVVAVVIVAAHLRRRRSDR